MSDENRIESAVTWFIENRSKFKKLCNKIHSILTEVLELEKIPYHIITSRVKDIDSFRNKISNEKYDNPIEQITDFSGIRIITYVEDDVKKINKIIESIFEIDTKRSIDKSTSLGTNKVGYKSVHYIAKLKEDRLSLVEYKNLENLYFEIQIRTILQHAWAEIEHDKNYKFSGKLPDEIARRFMLVAGSLEIADREFNNISKEIDAISLEVKKEVKSGTITFDLNTTSLHQFLKTKFEKLLKNGKIFSMNSSKTAIKELEKFGVDNLNDLNKLVTKDLQKEIEDYYLKDERKEIFSVGLIRLVLILTDFNKYFQQSYDKKWTVWNSRMKDDAFFKKHNIDWELISDKYGATL